MKGTNNITNKMRSGKDKRIYKSEYLKTLKIHKIIQSQQ